MSVAKLQIPKAQQATPPRQRTRTATRKIFFQENLFVLLKIVPSNWNQWASSTLSVATESFGVPSPQALEDDDTLNQSEALQAEVDDAELNKDTMAQLVHIFLRRVEHRGSDIRVDTGDLFRPEPATGNGVECWK